jgi:hypothetical protein
MDDLGASVAAIAILLALGAVVTLAVFCFVLIATAPDTRVSRRNRPTQLPTF